MTHPISDAQSRQFDDFVKKWQALLNLADWRIVKKAGKTSSLAEVFDFDSEARLVRYRLGSNWKTEAPTAANLEATAIHELLHVRLYDFSLACEKHGADSEQAGTAEHSIIIVLENLLLQLALSKREE